MKNEETKQNESPAGGDQGAGSACRQPCEVWTRVMGYFRPVSAFNIGKKQEHADRVCFDEKKATEE